MTWLKHLLIQSSHTLFALLHRDGKPITQKECIDRCDNPDLKPPANYTTIIVVSVVTVIVFFVIAALAKGYLNEQKLVKTHESKIVALKKSIQMLQQYNESEKQVRWLKGRND